MSDDLENAHFSGSNGPELFDSLANVLAERLRFEHHGPLADDEKTAFVWGFRHGVTQVYSLLGSAMQGDGAGFATIANLIRDAVGAWNLGVSARVNVTEPDDADNATKH